MARIVRVGAAVVLIALGAAPSRSQEPREPWLAWEKTNVGVKLLEEEGGPLNLGAALTWDVSGLHEARRWKGFLGTSGRLQTHAHANSIPLRAWAGFGGMHRLGWFGESDPFDPDLSVTAPVIDLGLRVSAEADQRFSEAQALTGLEARFENQMNAQGLMSLLPDLTANLDWGRRFVSDEREGVGLSEHDDFLRWSIAALWRSNLGYWTPGDWLDRFFVNYGFWHTEEFSPEGAWESSGFDRSTAWKVEVETQLADLIGDRRGGVLTPASLFVGCEGGVIAPATTENTTWYVSFVWDGRVLFRR